MVFTMPAEKGEIIKISLFKLMRKILPSAVKSRLTQLYHSILLIKICDGWVMAVLDRAHIKCRKYSNKRVFLALRNGDKIPIVMGDLDAQRIAEIFGENVYTPSFLSKYWRNSKVVFDIGANKGIFTLYAARLFPHATIHAYEPNPNLFPRLQENILLNNLQNRCVLSNCAVWHKSDILHFMLGSPKNPGTGQIVRNRKEANDFREVPAIAFTETLQMYQEIDFIKMDIEGAEYDVILRTPCNYLRRIKFIALEYHEHADFNIHDLIGHLRSAHFSVTSRPRGSILYAWQNPGS